MRLLCSAVAATVWSSVNLALRYLEQIVHPSDVPIETVSSIPKPIVAL